MFGTDFVAPGLGFRVLFVVFLWVVVVLFCFWFFRLEEEMEKKKVAVPLVCHGHSRPVVDLSYSPVTPDGFFLISASKGDSLFFFPSV